MPPIHDKESAYSAAQRGANAAFTVAAFTAIFAAISIFYPKPLGLPADPSSFVDAAIIGFLGYRIRRTASRAATITALLLYVVEQIYLVTQGAKPSILMVIFTLQFIYGIAGSLAYRRYCAAEEALMADAERLSCERP